MDKKREKTLNRKLITEEEKTKRNQNGGSGAKNERMIIEEKMEREK